MKKSLLIIASVALNLAMNAQAGNVGINTTTPGTVLDVNGAITNRETAVAVTSNAAAIPANVSQIQLTGAATASVAITAPAAPNAGQRLIIYNNTTGGFGATLNGFTVSNGQAMEFAYSNAGWRATNGGPGGSNWGILGNSGTNPSTNFWGTTDNQDIVVRTNNTEKMRVLTGGNVGIGVAAPTTKLHVSGNGSGVVATVENTTAGQAGVDIKNTQRYFRAVTDGNGDFLVYDQTANATRITVDGPTGNIGINNNPTPTANLDVNGTARVRNIPQISGGNGTTIFVPVFQDPSGNLVKASPTGIGNIMAGTTPLITAGGTQTVISGIPNGSMHRLTVVMSNGCTQTVAAEFWVIANGSVSGGTALQGIDGFVSTLGTGGYSFTETQTTSTITWTGFGGGCSGSNSTEMNFRAAIVNNAGNFQIQITNLGNVGNIYSAQLVRVGAY